MAMTIVWAFPVTSYAALNAPTNLKWEKPTGTISFDMIQDNHQLHRENL